MMPTTRRIRAVEPTDSRTLPDDPVLSADEKRRQRIADRAYRRAEARGFEPGQELDDWLAAEAEEYDDDHDHAR
jgi:hypothetical protein